MQNTDTRKTRTAARASLPDALTPEIRTQLVEQVGALMQTLALVSARVQVRSIALQKLAAENPSHGDPNHGLRDVALPEVLAKPLAAAFEKHASFEALGNGWRSVFRHVLAVPIEHLQR